MADPLADFRKATKKFEKQMVGTMTRATRQAAKVVRDEMMGLTGAVDHSLADLAREGHPYRVPDRGGIVGDPHPDYIVHEQSGALQGGLSQPQVAASGNQVTADIHSPAEHTAWLLLGTPTMRPRDFATAALINTELHVAATMAQAHAAVHDERHVQDDFRPDLDVMDHGAHPAQLPERG